MIAWQRSIWVWQSVFFQQTVWFPTKLNHLSAGTWVSSRSEEIYWYIGNGRQNRMNRLGWLETLLSALDRYGINSLAYGFLSIISTHHLDPPADTQQYLYKIPVKWEDILVIQILTSLYYAEPFCLPLHPGRLTWNLKITYLKRKITWTKPAFWGFQPLILLGCNERRQNTT